MAVNPHAEHLQELLEGLNEPQREAVTHGEGPLLILAGAGSGKTRVLTHRVAFLTCTDQAQASEILAITFTNKAAKEMAGRVERLLGRGTRGMWLMTFHAACARILRAEAERLGYTRQFTIYDQADARRLTKRCADAVGVDLKRYTPATIHARISALKSRLSAPGDCRGEERSPKPARAPQPGGGGRRFTVDLQLPRGRGPQHPGLPAGFPGRSRGQAGAELPLHANDPARGQRGDRQQPRRHRQAAVERAR